MNLLDYHIELTYIYFSEVPVRSRRCVTQRDFPKCTPSEYARHHSPSSASGPMYVFTDGKAMPVHLTPFAIGEEMSRLDPHYIPSPAPGLCFKIIYKLQ